MSNAEIFAPAIATYIGMPAFFLDHLALVKIPAYKESKVAPSEGGYPLIMFSHGWNGFNAQNTGQALQLASHGYVVIGVQHTYGAILTVFKDGTIAHNNPSARRRDEYEAAAQKLGDQWAGDIGFALDFMQNQNDDRDSRFFHSPIVAGGSTDTPPEAGDPILRHGCALQGSARHGSIYAPGLLRSAG
jgi:hypothetical protein